jgi:hypothetical protein
MVRQSCPTARLRGATRIQNRKLWREYGRRPFACVSRGWRARGVCLRVQLRTVGRRMCGLRAMGARRTRCCFSTARARPSRRRALSSARGPRAVGCSERADCSSRKREGRMWEVQAERRGLIVCRLGRPCARDCVMQLVEQLRSGAAATNADAAGRLAEQSSKWNRCSRCDRTAGHAAAARRC